MTDRPSAVPPFRIGTVTFECWITAAGVNEIGIASERFEWRAMDGRLKVGRHDVSGTYWASCGGQRIGFVYPSLKAAMCAAVAAQLGKAAA